MRPTRFFVNPLDKVVFWIAVASLLILIGLFVARIVVRDRLSVPLSPDDAEAVLEAVSSLEERVESLEERVEELEREIAEP